MASYSSSARQHPLLLLLALASAAQAFLVPGGAGRRSVMMG